MAKQISIKNSKIRTTGDDDQDYFDGLIKINRLEYVPGPTGTRMHMSLARTKIVRGGLGSGKSRAATEHINNLALKYPGSLWVIARKDLTSLKETTQREFLQKVVDSSTVQQFNAHENKLYYKNGSEVLFRETKDPDKFKSLEISGYMVDECDENDTPEAYEKLDERLRQKVYLGGVLVEPPYCGLLVFNPVDELHWLHEVAVRTDISVEDFRFDTYENQKNLPADYIANLIKRLPPWDVNRLVHGHWGKRLKGNPVLHGFKRETHVRPITFNGWLPLIRCWDFGYNHPAVTFCQIDPVTNRMFVLREFLGNQQKLQDDKTTGKRGVASVVKDITLELVSEGHPIFDYGDPHGSDEKDTGLSSVEYLRIHHGIHVIYRRERIRTGLDELQHKISNSCKLDASDPKSEEAPLLLVHPTCQWTIQGLEGGYERDEEGLPIKDGKFDHCIDTLRYGIVNNMNPKIIQKYKNKNRYKPHNRITGY